MPLQPSHVRGLYSKVSVESVEQQSFTLRYTYDANDEAKLILALKEIAEQSKARGIPIRATFNGSCRDDGKTIATVTFVAEPMTTALGTVINRKVNADDMVKFTIALKNAGGLSDGLDADDKLRGLARNIRSASPSAGFGTRF